MSKLTRLSIWVFGVVIILFAGFTVWYIATLYPAGPPQTGFLALTGGKAPMHGIGFGDGVHRELELLVKSGLSPREALMAATSKPAKILRAEHLGAIETGRSADLLVITGTPLENISDIRNVVHVFRDGRLVYSKFDE